MMDNDDYKVVDTISGPGIDGRIYVYDIVCPVINGLLIRELECVELREIKGGN